MAMYDPLNSGFADPNPGWTTTPTSQSSRPPVPESSPWQADTESEAGPQSPQNAASSSSSVSSPVASGPSLGPFGREPQVYGQPEPGLISPVTNKMSNGSTLERPEPYLKVRITGIDRNRRDILIRLDAQTNLPNFTGQSYRNISRSYFEFQQFYDQILHTSPQTVIPALPLAQTSASNDDEDDRLVRIMLQRWLQRICEDPILLQDEELRLFIESDFGYQPTVRPRRKASGGFSLVKRVVPDEDEALQRARFELTKLETQFNDAARSVDRLARARQALAAAQTEMGNKLINVSSGEGHPPLASALKKFGRTWHSLSDLGQAQAVSERVMLLDTFAYQGFNARSARETLLSRTAVLEEHQAAVKATIAKRRQIERIKASSNLRREKVDEALAELEDAVKYEELLARRVDGISQNLHRAIHRHSRLSHEDMSMVLIEHARSTIMYEKQHLRELESLRPDFVNAARKAVALPPVRPPPVRPLTPPSRVLQAPVPPPLSNVPVMSPQPSHVQPVQPYSPVMARPGPPISAAHPVGSIPPSLGSPHPVRPSSASAQGPLGPTIGPSTPCYVDTSKSMFVTPTPTSPLTSSTGSTTVANTHPVSPLTSSLLSATPVSANTVSSNVISDPLLSPNAPAHNPSYVGQAHTLGRSNGIGLGHPLAASVQVAPTHRRLDAREAAAKLANFL